MNEEILAYVKKHGSARWSELEKEFVEKRGWSKGKFVNQFKETKEYLHKVLDPKSGRYRYEVKTQHDTFAEKALLRSEISKGEFHEVEVPKERLGKISEEILSKIFSSLTIEASRTVDHKKLQNNIEKVRAKLKREGASKEELKYLDAQGYFYSVLIKAWLERKPYEDSLKILSQLIKIRIITEKGESTPTLTDEQIKQLFLTAALNWKDPNTKRPRKSLHVVVSFELPLQNK